MIDPRSTRAYKLEKENRELKKEIERLNKKIEQYENPEDMTLMFMWCDEKAKDEIKRLNNIIKEVREYIEIHTPSDIGICGNKTKRYYTLGEDSVDHILEILDGENNDK